MIIISPYSKKLPTGGNNPKNFPHWKRVAQLLRQEGLKTLQVGIKGEERIGCDWELFSAPLKDIKRQIGNCTTWISVDNFLPHLAKWVGVPGVVVFGKSDPNIFGYPENINLLKDKAFLRPNQWLFWHQDIYDAEAFVSPKTVLEAVLRMVKLREGKIP